MFDWLLGKGKKVKDTRPAWQKKIDDEANALELQKRQEEHAKEIAKQEEEKRRVELRQLKLKDLGNKFHCQITGCDVRSEKPSGSSTGGDSYTGGYIENWELPGDLYRCKRCEHWTCANHIYQGICMECAEKIVL